jgi:gamma-glutamyltranspeptidase/glutathione hydrolase
MGVTLSTLGLNDGSISRRDAEAKIDIVFLRKLSALLAVFLAFYVAPVRAQSASGRHGAVATVDRIASQAGIDAMKKGGNAVDAAVAAALTLGVVNSYNSGIGGGCFILIRSAKGELICIDGRETAPAAATRDMYVRDGTVVPGLSETGALASATPGELSACDLALKSWGKRSLKEHLLAAAQIAEQGFPIDARYAAHLRDQSGALAKFPTTRAVFLRPDGSPRAQGEILQQPDLARTYRAIAKNGIGWFYGGPFAQAAEKWMKENGGLMTASDLAGYHAVLREPISTTYRGCTVVSFPPPSSGGVHVLEILNMLETRDFADPHFTAVDRDQFIVEAMKLAFADRAYWLGDPDFAQVPRGLIRKDYARALAAKIDLTHASAVTGPGAPPDTAGDVFPKHTTHISTADAEGNWVAMTATINTEFGSKVVIPGTGVLMNNQMDDFSAQPGKANHFGLVGAEANAIAAGKRPLSSMSPAIVLKDNRPILAVGAAGGPTIISQTLLNIVGVVDFGMDAQTAIDQPKFHHQWRPDELKIERKMDPSVVAALAQRGQIVREVKFLGAAQAVGLAPDGQGFIGAADPRVNGVALAW